MQHEATLVDDVVGAVACLCIAMLGVFGRLRSFIHPRYVIFTTALAFIGYVLLVLSAYRRWTQRHQRGGWGVPRLGTLAVLAAIVGLIASPSGALTSYTANQRRTSRYVDKEAVRRAHWYDNPETIFQYTQVMSLEEGAQRLRGRKVMATGFVWDSPQADADRMYVGRMVISCCALDATPVALVIHRPGWRRDFPVNSWVRVTGTLVPADASSKSPLMVRPTGVERVERPKEPHDYIGY